MSSPSEWLAITCLALVLGLAVVRPRGLPEAVAALPAAILLVLLGTLTPRTAIAEIASLGSTVGFLAAILVLAHQCQREGLFEATGRLMATHSRGSGTRLLALVFAAAAATTAVLSLDATVVLLTPVVFATAARMGVSPRPHVHATAHLANSASLLLPVSNLTNLLAMNASGLGFASFAGAMAAPWLVALAVEWLVLRRHFAADLAAARPQDDESSAVELPRFALGVLMGVLAGFLLCSPLHLDAWWSALGGVVVLGGRQLWRGMPDGATRGDELRGWVAAANGWFVVFVLALGVVVRAVVDNGLAAAMGRLVPHGSSLVSLLALAGTAAVLANVVNNLPAVLVLLPLAAPAGPPAVLAVLIGVDIGPNLTYVGSLATLLWRRILADHGHDTEVAEFTRLGLATVPASLVLCTTALWGSCRLLGL